MPTNKLIYATSDASIKEYPGNTHGSFTFKLPQEINLVGKNKVLTVTFKGMYVPGTVESHHGKIQFFQIRMSCLDHQYTNYAYDDILIRTQGRSTAGYIEADHARPVSLSLPTISEIKFQILDDRGIVCKFKSVHRLPTIIKLEMSAMDAARQSFTIACDSNRSEVNESGKFVTKLPLETHLKGHYKVALTNVVIPGDILSGENPCYITFEGSHASLPNSVDVLKLRINSELAPNIQTILSAINQILLEERIGLYLTTGIKVGGKKKRSKEIKFTVQTLAQTMERMNVEKVRMEENNKKNKKKAHTLAEDELKMLVMKENRSTLHDDEEYMDIDRLMVDGTEFIYPQLIFNWMRITLNESLMYILNGKFKEYQFEMDQQDNKEHILNCEIFPSIERARPEALAVHCPIVTETVFAGGQDHLLQIIPSNIQNPGLKYLNNKHVYSPKNATYQDVTLEILRQIPIKITDLNGYPVRQAYNKQILIILHFIPM